MALYPINLDVGGKRCLVVGGGKVALGKTQELLRCGAEVEVVAPLICDELLELAESLAASPSEPETASSGQPAGEFSQTSDSTQNLHSPQNTASSGQPQDFLPEPQGSVSPEGLAPTLQIARRAYEAGDLHGCLIAIAATGDPDVNRQVFLDGHQQGVLVNSADDPENCHFTLPARVRKGDLLVTISTAGRSPAMASWLRRQIEAYLDEDILQMLEVVAEVRDEIKAQGIPTEPLDWATALNNGILELVREGKTAEAKSQLRAGLGIPAYSDPSSNS